MSRIGDELGPKSLGVRVEEVYATIRFGKELRLFECGLEIPEEIFCLRSIHYKSIRELDR